MTVYSVQDSGMMSEEAVSEHSVVTDDSMVSLSKDDYQAMLRTISGHNQKMQAHKNLHQLVHAKDNELRASREKAHNLQAALDRAEARLANQIRLAAASKSPCQSALEADSAVCEKVAAERELVTRVRSQPATGDDGPTRPASDIEMDGACVVEQSSRFHEVPSISSKHLPSPFLSDTSGTFVKSSAPSARLVARHADKETALQSTAPKTAVSSVRSVGNCDALTSLDVSTKVSVAGDTKRKSFGATGVVSNDLLDKLMHQNARLRKVIKDILEQRGTTIESHLEMQETRDVVTQLREELRLSKQRNEKLKQIIDAKYEDDLLKRYAEQDENFQKAKKMIMMLQAMVDAYRKENEKLQQEDKVLNERLSAAVTTRKVEIDETKGRDGDTAHSGLQETLRRCEEEAVKVEQLGRRCATLESEKRLLESQINVFQEDFAAEHKEYLEKQQQYEMTLAKHQDWIRQLAAEVQKGRSSLEEEKAKRMTAETYCHDIQGRFHKYLVDSRSTSSASCKTVEDFQIPIPSNHDLQVDSAAETSAPHRDLRPDQGFSAQSLADDTGEEVEGTLLVCPRCEREFEREDERKFRDHAARCTDD